MTASVGRVFSADLGFSMLTIAAGAYFCGRLLDCGRCRAHGRDLDGTGYADSGCVVGAGDGGGQGRLNAASGFRYRASAVRR